MLRNQNQVPDHYEVGHEISLHSTSFLAKKTVLGLS